MSQRIFNVKPSVKDEHDFPYQQKNITVPQSVDLREWDSPVEDQGMLGSCVANAITNSYELMQRKEDISKFKELSKLYTYYHARYIEKSVDADYGVVYIKNALMAVKKFGICTEELWPYKINYFAKQPSPDCYADACTRRIPSYTYVNTLNNMLENITEYKPIVIGMTVYKSFMNLTKSDPVVPLPTETDLEVGGHAVTVVGYSIPDSTFLIKNSFGVDWGNNGYALLPFEYVRLYAFDKWVFDINIS